MNYPISEKYNTPELMAKIMGPNPMKLQEELLIGHCIPEKSIVCDLGCGQGLTSLLLAKEYGFTVYAADLWCDPEKNRLFFAEMGLSDQQVIPVKADARALPFEKEFFDAVVSTDSYNFFGVDPDFLDEKLLPYVREGGYIYITCPGMKHATLTAVSTMQEQKISVQKGAFTFDHAGRHDVYLLEFYS